MSERVIHTETTALPGVIVLRPALHEDVRGFFCETYNQHDLVKLGITDVFVQDNHSLSRTPGTVRGLHFQRAPAETAKLIRVTRGAIFDVVVDIRPEATTFGRHVGVELSRDNWRELYVPKGFAHGFCTLQPDTEVLYKVTAHWSREHDAGIKWDDPALGIDWPIAATSAVLSERDRQLPTLAAALARGDLER